MASFEQYFEPPLQQAQQPQEQEQKIEPLALLYNNGELDFSQSVPSGSSVDTSLLTVSPYEMNNAAVTGSPALSMDSGMEGFDVYSTSPIPSTNIQQQPLDYILDNQFDSVTNPLLPQYFQQQHHHQHQQQQQHQHQQFNYEVPLLDINTPMINSTSTTATTTPKIKQEQQQKKELSPYIVPPESSSSPSASSSTSIPTPPPDGLDFNGRKPRKWRNRKYKCSHCNMSFLDKDLDLYAQHVQQVETQKGGIQLTRRKYKCADESCPWHKIGFLRKLEAQKHYVRKHGVPRFECRFWCENGEKIPGCGVCTTRWHADSGNRSRHEHAIHGKAFQQD